MQKIIVVLFLFALLFIPLNVNAGIRCADGWESSCTVSGPGCCSHHGGVAGSSSSSSSYSRRNYNSYSSNDDGDGVLGYVIIGLILGILIGIVITINGGSKSRR